MGASCPWNLSTVPMRAPGRRPWGSKNCALYGGMIRKSSRAIEDSAPSRSTHVVPDPNISETRSRTASASSDEELFEGHASTRYALRLAPLIFVRPGELRKAEWTEFNLEEGMWRIPGERMKTAAPHLVPLSS